MFGPDEFRELYRLLSGDQTVDDAGAPIDCGVQCDKFCCRPDNTTKYLLPGERGHLERALAERGDDVPFGFAHTGFFDTIVEPKTRACACEPLRELRTFNCRIFPYSPRIEGRAVTGVKKGKKKYLEPCWITEPAPAWAKDAARAWQMVFDDEDNRKLFARLWTIWDWSQALDRGEDAGHVLVVLAGLEQADSDEVWTRAIKFFSRSE